MRLATRLQGEAASPAFRSSWRGSLWMATRWVDPLNETERVN